MTVVNYILWNINKRAICERTTDTFHWIYYKLMYSLTFFTNIILCYIHQNYMHCFTYILIIEYL